MERFDFGPPAGWSALFDQAPLAEYENHPSGRFRTTFGPVFFRGRLDDTARVLVIGQDPSTDETLAQRILVGQAGQLVQGLLQKLGVVRSYVMFNTFLFGITGQFNTQMRTISATDPFRGYRNSLLDRARSENPIQAVLAFGTGAQHTVSLWPGAASVTVFSIKHPTAPSGVAASWNQALPQMRLVVTPDAGITPDLTPYGSELLPADQVPIPRGDLPFGVPAWHGSNGTHGKRKGDSTIIWTA